MPQNNQSITESPEFKEFCKKNNLEVFNLETINIVLFDIYRNYKEGGSGFFDHDKRIYELEEGMKTGAEMIFENYKQCIHAFESYKKTIDIKVSNLEEENKKLREMINEIAEHTRLPDFIDEEGQIWMGGRLIDKWNKDGK